MAKNCQRCGSALDGHLAHALGWCTECDEAPPRRVVVVEQRHHGFLVAPQCNGQGPQAGACRGRLRWSGPVSDGDVLCEAHWLVAEGYDYDEALAALGEGGTMASRCEHCEGTHARGRCDTAEQIYRAQTGRPSLDYLEGVEPCNAQQREGT